MRLCAVGYSDFAQLRTSSLLAPDEKRLPSRQSPVPAVCARSSPLCPMPEDAEVQKGMTLLPEKSLSLTKWLGGDGPPDGIAEQHGVVVRPSLGRGLGERHVAQTLVVVLAAHAAVGVVEVEVVAG